MDLALLGLHASRGASLFEMGCFPLRIGRGIIWATFLIRSRRALAKKFLNLFEEEAVPCFPHLRRGVIYGDANDHNALVDVQTMRVVSVIDFGDMHEGLRVAEPAVAAAYAILRKRRSAGGCGAVLAGYHEICH